MGDSTRINMGNFSQFLHQVKSTKSEHLNYTILASSDIFYVFTIAILWGSDPGTIHIFSNQATVEFETDYSENYSGFNATYTSFNTSELTSKYSL